AIAGTTSRATSGSWAYSAISEQSGWGAAAGRGRFPQLGIVGELLEGLVVAGRLEPRQRRAQKRIDEGRSVLDVEIDGLQVVAQMQLWVVVQSAALEPFVSVSHRPPDQIAEHVVVKVEL